MESEKTENITTRIPYKEVFEDIIENLNEEQLNDLIEEINVQKTLLKVKQEKRIKMKKELKAERMRMVRDMKESLKPKQSHRDFDSSDEDEPAPRKNKRNK